MEDNVKPTGADVNTTYVIGRDFYDRWTGRYSIRLFWNDKSGWVDSMLATHYSEPMRVDEHNPHEITFMVEIDATGSKSYTEVADVDE
jgi:hypothetical protein